MNKNTQFIPGEFCFDKDLNVYIEELVIKKEETEIVIKLETPSNFKIKNPYNYERALFTIAENGEAEVILKHQKYIKIYEDGKLLDMRALADNIFEFINYSKTPEGKQSLSAMRKTATQHAKIELKQEYDAILNNSLSIYCLKVSNDGKYMISTEQLIEKGWINPKFKAGTAAAISELGCQVSSFEELEQLLNTVLNLSSTPINIGQVVTLEPKQCCFYLKALSMGEDFLKDTLELKPLQAN